jgi:hypothetical protein
MRGRYTIAHFCWFLTMLGYSLIGLKFSPTTAPCALYTVKKKIHKFSNLFCCESFIYINNFDAKKHFLKLVSKYIKNIFFTVEPNKGSFSDNLKRKNWQNDFEFFLIVHFHVFSSRFSLHLMSYLKKYKRHLNNLKRALETRVKSLRHCFGTYYWTMHCHKLSKIINTKSLITFLQCKIKIKT